MALPILDTATYELTLPSSDVQVKYRPFLVKEEKILLMAMESENAAEITKALKGAKPSICELIMDHEQEQMPKAINKRLPNGKTVPTKFEDMYPFLPSNEIKESMI